jgi:competence protein ComEC
MLRTDVKKAAALLTCAPVVAYALLAGFHVPSQRAMIMVLAFLFSLILGREKEVWSTLALAGLLILALDPRALFSTSFHLSFAAVTGILIITPAVMEWLPGRTGSGLTRRLCLYLGGLIIVSVAATLFVLPLVSHYFHRISLVTVPANVTVIPILGLWIIPLGFLSAVTLPLSGTFAGLLLQLGGWGLKSMTAIIRFWADLPGASIWVPAPNTLEIALLYAMLTALLFHRRSLWIKWGVFVLCLILLLDIGYWTHRVRFNRDLRITYLDVGQGNAALVEFPRGKKMLIDGGGFPGDHFDVGQGVVAPFLWHSKISQIHYLVLSHPQADHMNGLRFIAKAFDPEEFWHNGVEVSTATYRELMDIVASRQIRQCLPKGLAEGREINGARVDLLHPLPGIVPKRPSERRGDLNNGSLVLKIACAGRSFLFPGDLEKEGEATLVSNAGQALQCHVLLSPHHGSRNSNSSPFLQKARPRICVISSRGEHFFGFPHPETLERLHRIGCRVLRIDQCGAVQCRVGPGGFEITTFLGDRRL